MSIRAPEPTRRFRGQSDSDGAGPVATRGAASRRPLGAKALLSTLAGALLLASATAAWADEVNGLKVVDLNIRGRLNQRCALGKVDGVDFGDLTHPGGKATARVALDCNLPISITLSAAHGALANDRYPLGQGPYAGSVPYSLGVQVPVRYPSQAVVLHRFEGSDLVGAGRTFTTGDGIAVDGMNLDVSLGQAPGDAGLVAGAYGETIEITIAPS
jgi:hypothetical protein